MARSRRKATAVLRDLETQLDRLLRIDAENQSKASPGPGRPRAGRVSPRQLHILTEGVFFAAFRQYEEFQRDIFLLYCSGQSPPSGGRVRSYLSPRSFDHAESLVKSAMPFLDWSSPEVVRERAEVYLKDGFPVKDAIVPRMSTLQDLKRLRNHIAHRSADSLRKYLVVLRGHYGVVPLVIPEPGEFLLEPDPTAPARYKLLVYLDCIRDTARSMA